MRKKGQLNTIKIIILVVILTFTLLFQGCSTDGKDEASKANKSQMAGEIVETQLTDREKELLRGVGIDKFLVFDANIKNKNIKKIDFWVDYYEKGSFRGRCSGVGTDVEASKDKNFKMVFSTNNSASNLLEEKLTFSISSNGSGGKGSTNIKISEKMQQTNFENIKQSEIVFGKEVILAVIVGTEGASAKYVSIDALNNKDETIKNQANKELLQNDYVYIVKCKFN